jgi:hypothetical protein
MVIAKTPRRTVRPATVTKQKVSIAAGESYRGKRDLSGIIIDRPMLEGRALGETTA